MSERSIPTRTYKVTCPYCSERVTIEAIRRTKDGDRLHGGASTCTNCSARITLRDERDDDMSALEAVVAPKRATITLTEGSA